MSSVAENNPEQSAEMVKKIGVNSQRMLENMSDIVWTVNPDNDSFSYMLVRMNQYAAQMMEPKGIRFKITTDDGSENMELAIEHRHDFYLIFKEAINNLAKYSECAEANIVITGHLKFLSMKITDNGKGFDLSNRTSGNGLKNMRKRAENIDGDLKISSVAGNGTSIELQIPIT
jgi:signal transduction histidine kinase